MKNLFQQVIFQKRIQEYCKRTGQYVPQNEAEIVRCIDQSLAVKYRFALEQIEIATGKKYDTLNIIGGGIQSKLLCQLTADVCGRKSSGRSCRSYSNGKYCTTVNGIR